MPKLNQFETLVIHEFEDEKFHLPPHTHTYYEIIYIKKGSGVHHLNNNLLPYKSGDLFVISPEDEHYFDIKKSTRFVYIKFTDNYFNSKQNLTCDEFLIHTPENFMRDKLLKETVLKLDDPCKTILKNTIENITAYNCKTDVSTSPIIFYQILSIFGVIKETIKCMNLRMESTHIDNEQIATYIHQNIYNPKLVQIKVIASHFNIAETYFSAYFKRTFSISYRDYINNLRTTLIEKRIHNDKLSIKQIAYEFGFTDESHLSNYFKKKKNMKPTDFKKS
ncbi:AraC family transcriptional regulator [Flavobacterium sp. WLB]|uniref:AraC family transcriptional regulator n=1 Tax=unclassified Flavobacterium TaxID=196869 RepID=UPI0006AB87F5|nr:MULTISPECIES: AraC family transcriptional regulator [unclassified Flavobacterium]KOP37787.1 cupin [Flavobacterium sp. VMW]OWU90982.1 cupin [Flavobacterium sp. NLM]PUU67564.1 AraC family transcriptional regulator [Flavobacterium sp. WLB]